MESANGGRDRPSDEEQTGEPPRKKRREEAKEERRTNDVFALLERRSLQLKEQFSKIREELQLVKEQLRETVQDEEQ